MKLQLLLAMIFILPVALAANINLDELDIIKFTLAEKDQKTIQFNEKEYTITADSVTEEQVMVTFQPGNQALAVKKEQSLDDIDLDEDGSIDLSVNYLSNKEKTASLEIKRLEQAKKDGKEDGKKELIDTERLSSALKQNLKYIIGAVVVLIILILIFSRKKGNPEKFYRRAESLHREAQEFHEDGDEETALELYEKAEELREKARGLERGGL